MRDMVLRFKTIVLCAALLLLCTACGNGAEASVMKLAKTAGTVSVRNEKEKELKPEADMSLYSGYWLGTEKDGYLWINLDSVKLAKLDEESDIEIQKSGKDLEILLNSGNLFFHVTEPLEEDETMNIRTSNMAVGIRGTCGWVRVIESGQIEVYILEGTVECSITDPDTGEILKAAVAEGELARLVWKDGQGAITVEKFTEEEIPFFVAEELGQDPELKEYVEKVLAANVVDTDDENVSGGGDAVDGAEAENGDEPERFITITTNRNELQFVNGNGAGGVIITKRDDLYGAVNLEGEEIVPNGYSVYVRTPNNEGQFALGDGENFIVFDNQGNVVVEMTGIVSIQIAENAVTYGRINADGIHEAGCYDILEGCYTSQTVLTDTSSMIGGTYVTGLRNGEFWYVDGDELRMRRARKDGSIVWTDEAVEAEDV
ncbi:MAG: FecR family protein, partial [Lachnospiraceae bacterium]|nr:FecR family protein [Lachnospiraceae bacterium]